MAGEEGGEKQQTNQNQKRMHEGKDGRPGSAVKLQAFCFVEIFFFFWSGGKGEREMCALVSWCDSCAKPFAFKKKI